MRVFLSGSLSIVTSAEDALPLRELLRVKHVHFVAQVASISRIGLRMVLSNDCGLRGLSPGLDPARLPNIFTLVKRLALLNHGLGEAALEFGEDARLHVVLRNLL